ncbi:MAG TPA: OmpA family protein [Chryseosolibacter sp.]
MRLSFTKVACIAAIFSIPLTVNSQNYVVVVGTLVDGKASEFKGYLPVQFRDSSHLVSKLENIHFYFLKTSDQDHAILGTLPKEAFDMRKTDEGFDGPVSQGKVQFVDRFEGEENSSRGSSPGSVSSESTGVIPAKPVGKYFKFRIESPEGQILPGMVHQVDFDNEREVAAYNANSSVDLLRPGRSSSPMTLVCGLFGYKEIHKYIDYSDPARTDDEAYLDNNGIWVIPYKLERVEKGDVSLMYNVSFYKDAAVMRKSAQADLDELVKMMHSNPYYEITIHAHCNGKGKRQIIAPGANRNYFDVAGSVQVNGSAKDLTTLRAEAIRGYLAEHGVDLSRVEIFAWGASDMLVRQDAPNSTLNDRIEIEFTRD